MYSFIGYHKKLKILNKTQIMWSIILSLTLESLYIATAHVVLLYPPQKHPIELQIFFKQWHGSNNLSILYQSLVLLQSITVLVLSHCWLAIYFLNLRVRGLVLLVSRVLSLASDHRLKVLVWYSCPVLFVTSSCICSLAQRRKNKLKIESKFRNFLDKRDDVDFFSLKLKWIANSFCFW